MVSNSHPKDFLQSLSYTPAEMDVISRAFDQLCVHDGAVLPSGEPKTVHLMGTASIVAAMRMDFETVAAALLLFEKQEALLQWGEIAALVEGVKKFSLIEDAAKEGQLEDLRKMLLAMVQDFRVVLLKLADVLQSLRFLVGSKEEPLRRKVALETKEIFAPLANRLGLWQIKWEMEDFSLRILEPFVYKKIAGLLDEKRKDREEFIRQVIERLKAELSSHGIQCEISGRPKHIYSIYKKMQKKKVGFEDVYDVRAVRVLVEDIKNCYAVLGIVHSLWTPIEKEFDDYIAKPKENGYRSLHTGVIGPEGKALEVQIRTFQMHQDSEMGFAAHWRYKEGMKRDAVFEERIAYLRKVLEWKDELSESPDFGAFKSDIFQDAIYVLTPQGKVIDLPQGSTPVDFAYHVHTDLGHRCRGAKVDGAIVPLDFSLKTGQRVEIIAAKQGGPSRDWLNPEGGFARSSRARAKIRQWFNSQNQAESIAHGREILEKEMRRLGMTSMALEKAAEKLHFDKLDEFLMEIGRGEITSRQIQAGLKEEKPAEEQWISPKKARQEGPTSGILIVGVDKLMTSPARCCKPAPPDRIVGFVTKGRGVTIHRRHCKNLQSLDPERLIAAQWGQETPSNFPVDIEVEALDRPGLLRDISEKFSRDRINVIATNSLSKNDKAKMGFTVEVSDLSQLEKLLGLIREIPGVLHALRR